MTSSLDTFPTLELGACRFGVATFTCRHSSENTGLADGRVFLNSGVQWMCGVNGEDRKDRNGVGGYITALESIFRQNRSGIVGKCWRFLRETS